MLSLDNALDVARLRKFMAGIERAVRPAGPVWVCEPKVDGVGVAILYRRAASSEAPPAATAEPVRT